MASIYRWKNVKLFLSNLSWRPLFFFVDKRSDEVFERDGKKRKTSILASWQLVMMLWCFEMSHSLYLLRRKEMQFAKMWYSWTMISFFTKLMAYIFFYRFENETKEWRKLRCGEGESRKYAKDVEDNGIMKIKINMWNVLNEDKLVCAFDRKQICMNSPPN